MRSRYARRPNYYASSVPPERQDQRERPSFTQQRDARSVRDPRDRDTRQDSVYSDRDSRERPRARGDSFSSSTTKDYNTNGRENSPPLSARWKASNNSQTFRKAGGPGTPERNFERRADDLGRRTSNGGRPRSLSPVNQGYMNGSARRSSEYPSGSISARDGMGERYDRDREREPQRGRGYNDYGDRFPSRDSWYNGRPAQPPMRYYDDDRPSASASSSSSNTANTALPPPPPPANTVIGKRTRAHEQMEERESQQQQQQQNRRPPPSYAQSRPNNLHFGNGNDERRSSVSRGSEPYSARSVLLTIFERWGKG